MAGVLLRTRALLATCKACIQQPSTSFHPAVVAAQMRNVTTAAKTESDPPEARIVYGCMRQVKTSPMKLNLVAKLIRNMTVMDAIAQTQFSPKKAARFVHTTLLDTQRRAAESYGIDPVNLHVAESFVGKGHYLKRIRYHGRGMHGIMHKYYAHYFLKLKEGPPPPKKKKDPPYLRTKKWIEAGPRPIPNSL